MNKPVNAEQPLPASKPHYSVKAVVRRGAAWVAAALKLTALQAHVLQPQTLDAIVASTLAPKPRAIRPITLKLGASRRLSLLLLAIMLMAQLALLTLTWFLPWPWFYQLLAGLTASLLLLWLGGQALRRHAWRQSDAAVILLALDQQGAYSLTLRDGRKLPVHLQDDSVVFASLSLLNFRLAQGKGRVTCLILPDAVDAHEFRRLRVWLRWGAFAGELPWTVQRP